MMRRSLHSFLNSFVLVAAISAAGTAWSQNLYYFYSAKIRMPECRAFLTQSVGDRIFTQGQCATIISELISTATAICVPKNAPIGQAVRTVVKYIDAQPARYDENFVQLAREALQQQWPCHRR